MITIQINEHTKAGKAILELVKLISNEQKGVKIIETPKKTGLAKEYPISKNIPNAKTDRVMRKNDKEGTKGLKKFDSAEALFEDSGI